MLVTASAIAMRADAAARVDHGQRRALAQRQRFTEVAFVVAQTDRAVGDRHLPWPHHLVAGTQAADRPVADGDQERLVGNGGQAQHTGRHDLQLEPDGIDAGQITRSAAAVARHARRLAQQHVDRHVDRTVAVGAFENQLMVFGDRSYDRVGAAFTRAQPVEELQRLRCDRQHVALLRFVAPDLGR
jgi:hypothetical protein